LRTAPDSAKIARTAMTTRRITLLPQQGRNRPAIMSAMTLRPPHASSSSTSHDNALDYEIAQEKAAALGRLGRALETALAALAEHELKHDDHGETRAELVQDASDALWCFIVQREACGLRDPRPVIRDYRVPAVVQNRMGVISGKRQAPSG
jgi:hypothetical protein